MKFNLATILAATMTATVAAAPTEGMGITARAPIDWVDGSHANFIKLWKEDGMNRWRWAYAGATCEEFKHAVKTRSGGTVNNYRCLKKDGKLLFDTNMVVGSAGDISIISAIKAITRQPCCDLGLPAWGMDRCLHENGDDDSEKNC